MTKKIIVVFSLISALLLLSLFMTGSANNTEEYVLYKNDTKFSLSEYPAVKIDSEIFVPSSFFIGFNKILYEYSPQHQSFYFMNTQSGNYFAYSLDTDIIIVNGTYEEKKFPIINSTIYMPLQYCSELLSLKIERKKDGKAEDIRVTDGSQRLSFDELIKLFNPSSAPTPPQDPIVPIEPDNPNVPTKKSQNIYLMLKVTDPELITEAINTLRAFGERATFFFDTDALAQLPEEAVHVLVEGNGIGICAKDSSAESLKQAKNTLALITNHCSRICLLDNNATVPEGGYAGWRADIDCADYSEMYFWTASDTIYAKAKEMKRCAIELELTADNMDLFASLLGNFTNDDNITLSIIDSSVPEIINE